MATLGDLKARILLETNRDDLAPGGEAEAGLKAAIERAIEYYCDQPFWFNRACGVAVTTAGSGQVIMPYAVRIADSVTSGDHVLSKASLGEIDRGCGAGRPRRWADGGDVIYLSPVPDGAYTLRICGIAAFDPPASDSDESVWTNEAQDLIAARVRFLLYRDIFRDTEGTQLAAQAEGEALQRLRSEARRRNVHPLHSPDGPWATSSFDITRG